MSMIETTDIERRIAGKIDQTITGSMALATNRTGGLVFANMGQVMEFAKAMAISDIGVRKHLRGRVGACLAVTVQAIEWEMSPFAVASKSYAVNDQIAYEAQLINAVILRRAPITGRFKISYSGVGETRVCTVALAMRDGGPDASYDSPVFSKIQPKNSPLWKTDPDQQQFYYSSRALCRRHFPDVLLGVYAVDELIDSDPEPPRPRGTPMKTLGSRLEALAADPDTGEILDNPSSPAEFTPSSRQDEAAAGNAFPVENGAGQAANDLEAGPAPDPRQDRPTPHPHPLRAGEGGGGSANGAPAIGPAVGSREPEGAAPRQGPQTGGEAFSGAAPPATSTPAEKAVLADVIARGDAAAAEGPAAILNYLGDLPKATKAMLPEGQILKWNREADRKSGARK